MTGLADAVVLVADDDEDQRFILRRLLTRGGAAEVVDAADGAAALTAARSRRFDLILLDIDMPVRSGLDVLPDLHAAAGGAPIVMVSSFPREQMAGVARTRGAIGYVEKRTAPDRLLREILLAADLTSAVEEIVSTQLGRDLTAPGSARRFVRDRLGPHDADASDVAQLLVSELVSNAVTHAASGPRVDIHLTPEAIRIQVHDDDPTAPRRRVPDESGPGGRGLVLLDSLASRWSSEPSGIGKVVWFELDRDPRDV